MSDHPFLRFIELVSFDQKIQSFEREKKAVDAEIIALSQQIENFVAEHDEAHKRIFQLKKRVDEQELEMKVLDQKEKDKKKRLEHLSDYKEYQAIKAEIEAIQRVQLEQEQAVLDAWSQVENAQQVLQKKTKEHEKGAQEMRQKKETLEQKSAQLNGEISAMVSQRAEQEANVPTEWLEKYTMMRARVADPVVEIFHQSCGVCSRMITTQEMMRAKKGALVQCQQCFRLLYAPEMMEKHEKTS
jgi:predicted  nucleic acid-binding Zn-ribbon protein